MIILNRDDLVIPDYRSADLCILGLDPSTVRVGLSVLHFDNETLELTKLKAYTLRAEHLFDQDSELVGFRGNRNSRLLGLSRQIGLEIKEAEPFMVVHEAAYFDRRKPTAFEALSQSIAYITQAVVNVSERIQILPIEASIAKKAVGVTGKGKEAVEEALLRKKDILEIWKNSNRISISELDEHSRDAIAMAYSGYLEYKKRVLPDVIVSDVRTTKRRVLKPNKHI